MLFAGCTFVLPQDISVRDYFFCSCKQSTILVFSFYLCYIVPYSLRLCIFSSGIITVSGNSFPGENGFLYNHGYSASSETEEKHNIYLHTLIYTWKILCVCFMDRYVNICVFAFLNFTSLATAFCWCLFMLLQGNW